MSSKSPLEFLQSHFAALQPRPVEIKGFPFKLVFHPLNAEQSLKLSRGLRETKPAAQALIYAELLVETVKTEDGAQAFPLEKGGPNPIEVLTKGTSPKIFTELVNRLIDWLTGEVEELEKK